MTNQQIIAAQQYRLFEEGVLRQVGTTKVKLPGGDIKELPKIQDIHTFAAWKSFGFKVRKGEKAVAKFPIWKFVVSPKQEETEEGEIEGAGKMIMKIAAFFTEDQVERIEK